jgi:mRNA-degrading endonuclease RelE of RelBE toxin-antitoxin system
MSYSIKTIPQFDKQLKRLVKKYPSFKTDFSAFIPSLRAEPTLGTPIGKGCFKIRIAIASKGKGKSGGARIITNFVVTDSTVYLLSIYDKSEKENLTDKELKELLRAIPQT